MSVFVLDKKKQPLMPCSEKRARLLLERNRAVVHKVYPFTIRLKDRVGGNIQPIELKVDPGSKTTGIALVANYQSGRKVAFAANLNHRGHKIAKVLLIRRMYRRNRRYRKTRYRKPRFLNRRRPEGWLAPSIQSRVDNVYTIAKRLISLAPVSEIMVETVRFDTQKLQDPEINGIQYQQGTLTGYEVREYLLEKWNRQCAYCGAKNVPLEIDHIIPKSAGGSNRISNLTLACHSCNQKKGNHSIEEFIKNKNVIEKIKAYARTPLRDAAVMNSIRYAVGNTLKSFGLPVSFFSGGRTKYNRVKQNFPKDHWIDAACVGNTGEKIFIPKGIRPLIITATGRGYRQMCYTDKYGFPKSSPKSRKIVKGFMTGDIVKAVITTGKNTGAYLGRIAVRSSGSFKLKTVNGIVDGISYRFCKLIQRGNGYNYSFSSPI